MLFYETIHPSTLELLKNLQKEDAFSKLLLVGGTSLALQIGHRISVDIDLFGEIHLPKDVINNILSSYGKLMNIHQTDNINIYTLNGIKTDIVNYSYPWLNSPVADSGLRLASKEDIAAMKLSAVTGRGSKKDFIDIFFLLREYSIQQMLSFYEKKYSDGSIFMVLRSLSYFEDADLEPMPKMLIKTDWDNVKQKIISEIKKVS